MRYFLTTAIDYVNSRPHLGTAYEKITADVIARYHRLKGDDTRFLMGNDEHSQNVFKQAQEQGQDPLAYCDEMEQAVPRDVGAPRHLVRRLHPHHRPPRHFAGGPGDGAGLSRQRRHLRRRLRGLVLRRLRGVQAGEGPGRRAVPDPQDQARVDQGEELVLPAVEVPAAAARSSTPPTRRSSSRRSAATRSSAWSRAASTTSRSAARGSRGASRCRSTRPASSTCGSTR